MPSNGPSQAEVSQDDRQEKDGVDFDQDADCQDVGSRQTSVQRRLSDWLNPPKPGDKITATVNATNGRGDGPTDSVTFVYPEPAATP